MATFARACASLLLGQCGEEIRSQHRRQSAESEEVIPLKRGARCGCGYHAADARSWCCGHGQPSTNGFILPFIKDISNQ
jgi:hypothetical protein